MEIDFDKMQGLVPAVIQDASNRELLMVGFMNRKALETTLRDRLRPPSTAALDRSCGPKVKPPEIRLEVVAAWTDCDRDTVPAARPDFGRG